MTTVPVTLQDTSSPHVFSVLLPHKKNTYMPCSGLTGCLSLSFEKIIFSNLEIYLLLVLLRDLHI